MKTCKACGADISHRPAAQTRFCEDPECHKQRMLAHARASYQRNREDIRERQNEAYRARVAARPKKQRLCAHCGKDISDRGGRARWCDMKCRERARHSHSSRTAHRWNTYAARIQRERGLPVDPPLTVEDWAAILPAGAACVYCGKVASEPDHVVPLSRGGRHLAGNIVPSCMTCNRSKQDRSPRTAAT